MRGQVVWIEWQGRRRQRREVIAELHAAGVPTAEIARQLGVRYQIVYMALKGAPKTIAAPPDHPPEPIDIGPVDAVLLGCVKTKDVRPRPAKDLYVSELFRRRRRYAEASGRPWWIVSAEYGLVHPDEVIAPYDTLIGRRSLDERQRIAAQVADRLERELGSLRGKRLELHAGDEYFQAIGPTLRRRGALIVRPLEGLSIGRQLAWYGERLGLTVATEPRQAIERPAAIARPERSVRRRSKPSGMDAALGAGSRSCSRLATSTCRDEPGRRNPGGRACPRWSLRPTSAASAPTTWPSDAS